MGSCERVRSRGQSCIPSIREGRGGLTVDVVAVWDGETFRSTRPGSKACEKEENLSQRAEKEETRSELTSEGT